MKIEKFTGDDSREFGRHLRSPGVALPRVRWTLMIHATQCAAR
jgi:hypothetical protein